MNKSYLIQLATGLALGALMVFSTPVMSAPTQDAPPSSQTQRPPEYSLSYRTVCYSGLSIYQVAEVMYDAFGEVPFLRSDINGMVDNYIMTRNPDTGSTTILSTNNYGDACMVLTGTKSKIYQPPVKIPGTGS